MGNAAVSLSRNRGDQDENNSLYRQQQCDNDNVPISNWMDLNAQNSPTDASRNYDGSLYVNSEQFGKVPNIEMTQNVHCPSELLKNSFVLIKDEDTNKYAFQFAVDAQCEGMATVHVVAKQLKNPEMVTDICPSSPKQEIYRFFRSQIMHQIAFGQGKKQILQTEPFLEIGKTISISDLLYHKGSQSFPVVIVLKSKTASLPKTLSEGEIIDSQCTYLSLNNVSGVYTANELKRTMTIGNSMYTIRHFFGSSVNEVEDSTDTLDSPTECVICLTAQCNTTCCHVYICVFVLAVPKG